jgi:hypothetical protein
VATPIAWRKHIGNLHSRCSPHFILTLSSSRLSYHAFGGLLAGVPSGRAGGWPCPLCLIWIGRGTINREITVPNLLYYSNFFYYCPPTWSRGEWQSRWLPTEVRRRLFDPSNLPSAVSQCPFDPHWAGAKVYRAGGRAGGPTHNPGHHHKNKMIKDCHVLRHPHTVHSALTLGEQI